MKTILKQSHFLQTLCLSLIVFSLLTSCKDDDDPKPTTINAPTLAAATDITKESFKISWEKVTDAEKYLLDVSEKSDFSTKVTGFDHKSVTATSISVTGLKAKTTYYVRAYAQKGTTKSKASSSKSLTTKES